MLQEFVTHKWHSHLLNGNNFGRDEPHLLSGMSGSFNMGFKDIN